MEWGEERKEKKEKTEKVGPPILSLMGEARCLPGTQTRSRLRDRETHVSPIEPLRLSTSGPEGMGRDQTDQSQGHLDLKGWGGTRQIRAKGGRESRKRLRRRGALEQGMLRDLQNVASSVFLSHPTLVLPWGLGGR